VSFLLNSEVNAYDTFSLKKNLKLLGEYTVERVVDGDTILLKNGEYVRLLGLQAPALDHNNIKTLASGSFSKKYLESLVLDEKIDLYKASVKRDRYGRILGHLFLKDGRWVQGEMLNSGMAIVYSFADNRKLVSEMLEEEQLAEKENVGLWGQGFYKVKMHDEAYKYIHGYEMVKGKVLHIGRYKKMFFINFGDDWNKDFTIVISGKAARRFEKSAIDIWEYRGKVISVRGWLKEFKGPTMSISHPEQINILYE
jgi:endonuclease YncB( thermonuclease family)